MCRWQGRKLRASSIDGLNFLGEVGGKVIRSVVRGGSGAWEKRTLAALLGALQAELGAHAQRLTRRPERAAELNRGLSAVSQARTTVIFSPRAWTSLGRVARN